MIEALNEVAEEYREKAESPGLTNRQRDFYNAAHLGAMKALNRALSARNRRAKQIREQKT